MDRITNKDYSYSKDIKNEQNEIVGRATYQDEITSKLGLLEDSVEIIKKYMVDVYTDIICNESYEEYRQSVEYLEDYQLNEFQFNLLKKIYGD